MTNLAQLGYLRQMERKYRVFLRRRLIIKDTVNLVREKTRLEDKSELRKKQKKGKRKGAESSSETTKIKRNRFGVWQRTKVFH